MKINDLLFWFLFGLGIILVVWLFIGNTPTIEQALLVLILTMVVKNSIDIKGIKTGNYYSQKKFDALATDFKEHIKHK